MGILRYIFGAFGVEDETSVHSCSQCNGTGVDPNWPRPYVHDGGPRRCGVCGGTGTITSTWGCGSELLMRLFFVAIGGVLVLIGLASIVALWTNGDSWLRPLLESIFGDAVAQRRRAEGNPVLVGIVVAIPVVVAGYFLTKYRRVLIRKWYADELPRVAVVGFSLLRMAILLLGVALVPVAMLIADAADLRADPGESNPLTTTVPLLIAAAVWVWLTIYGLNQAERRIEKRITEESGTDTGGVPPPDQT